MVLALGHDIDRLERFKRLDILGLEQAAELGVVAKLENMRGVRQSQDKQPTTPPYRLGPELGQLLENGLARLVQLLATLLLKLPGDLLLCDDLRSFE